MEQSGRARRPHKAKNVGSNPTPAITFPVSYKMQCHTITPKLESKSSRQLSWAGFEYVGTMADSNQLTGKRAAEVIR